MIQFFHWSDTALLVFFVLIAMIIPGIVMWSDEKLFVNEVEKEQREQDKPGPLGST